MRLVNCEHRSFRIKKKKTRIDSWYVIYRSCTQSLPFSITLSPSLSPSSFFPSFLLSMANLNGSFVFVHRKITVFNIWIEPNRANRYRSIWIEKPYSLCFWINDITGVLYAMYGFSSIHFCFQTCIEESPAGAVTISMIFWY